MQTVSSVLLQIISLLEMQVAEGNAVAMPRQYHGDYTINTLGRELLRLDIDLTNYLFSGIIMKTPTDALRHARALAIMLCARSIR